jgi:ABC-type histidine transport system ATPase subunit
VAGEAAQMSNRVAFTGHGTIIEEGPPYALFSTPRSERLPQFLQTRIEHNALFPLRAHTQIEIVTS